MAVVFETSEPIERGSSYFIATNDIVIDAANNGRHILPDITALKESIRQFGQNTPCLVGKDGTKAKMIEGHSRWRAICEINKEREPADHLKVWCVYFKGNEVDALAAGFEANRRRNSLTRVDEGYFVDRLLKYGKTIEQVAEKCKESVEWCKERLALVELTPEAQSAVNDPSVPITAAVALSKLAAAEQRRYLKSGEKLTAAKIKKSTAPPKKNKPRRAGLTDVKSIMEGVVKDGIIPSEMGNIGQTERDALHLFCGVILDKLNGTEEVEREAKNA